MYVKHNILTNNCALSRESSRLCISLLSLSISALIKEVAILFCIGASFNFVGLLSTVTLLETLFSHAATFSNWSLN